MDCLPLNRDLLDLVFNNPLEEWVAVFHKEVDSIIIIHKKWWEWVKEVLVNQN